MPNKSARPVRPAKLAKPNSLASLASAPHAPAARPDPSPAAGGTGAPAPRAPGIVSSSHLVSPRSVELSEFEFGLIVAWNAFARWAVRCMAAAGCPDLTITDVLLLHHLCHRARNKKLADICFVLNYEDTHVVAYSLRKLVAAGFAQAYKQGKEVFYRPTEQGEALVERYRTVREQCLVASLDTERNADIGELARLLRTMSGLYDQAARAATSL
jgi:predicted MarR family transcription regulator